MNKILNRFLSLLYPHRCSFCKKPIDFKNDAYICDLCRQSLPHIEKACMKCGRPIGEHALLICADCRKNKFSFSGAYIPLRYESNVRSALLRMKFSNARFISRSLALLIAEKIIASQMPLFDFITYVPVSPDRMRERGFDQSALIASFLSEIIKVPVVDCFDHLPGMPRQSSLSKSERFKNARLSFSSKEMTLSGTALLVDDIFTTGATLGVCASLLLKMGCSSVYIAAGAAKCK